MSKRKLTRKQKNARFWLILAICAMVFLLLTGFGLMRFWDYMEAYEASRPQNAIESYMSAVTPQSVSALPDALPEGLDIRLQSEDAARQVIADSMDTVSYAKNTKLSTDTKMVYMLLSRGKTVGQVAMTVVRTDEYGLEYWAVTEESCDFSRLLGQSASITVPEGYPVYVGGVLLDESYISESGIHYASVEEYYADYELPTMCTYTAGPVLGEIAFTVTDPEGVPVEIGPQTDMEQFLKNCTQEELDRVADFLDGFVQCYTDFTSVTGGQDAMQGNYKALSAYMVSGGKLAQRMKEAMAGLLWVTDRNASVSSVTVDRCLRLEEGRWLCDFTYVVDTRDFSGRVESVSSVQMVIVETQDGLKAESMISK